MAPSPLRVTRTKEQARNYYSAISGFYDLLSGGAEGRLRDDAIRRLDVRRGEKVLEIGIGTGLGIQRIAEAADSAESAVGLDLAPGMLAAARRRLDASGFTPWALVCADGAGLPFRDGTFDAVFMSFTLELFDTPEIPRVLEQSRRVLKESGRVGIVSMGIMPNPNRMSRLYAAMHSAFPILVDCRPIDARSAVIAAGFTVTDAYQGSLFSLPVDIVLARKIR